MFAPRSVPACVPSEPDGLGLSRSAAQARKRAPQAARTACANCRGYRMPRGIMHAAQKSQFGVTTTVTK